MSRMMIQAAVTMGQLQKKLDVVGHNLANSQTNGYKSRHVEFSSLLFQQINNLTDASNASNRLTPEGIRTGTGVKVDATNIDLASGAFKTTDRELDTVLLNENNMYQVEVESAGGSELQFTRDGAFYLQATRNNTALLLTTADGHPVLGENGRIELPTQFDSIDVKANGDIVIHQNGEPTLVDTLAIYEVFKPRLLEGTGHNFFRIPEQLLLTGNLEEVFQQVDGDNLVQNGKLESSNVDVAEQMSEMIIAQRAYQFNARTISMADQMLGLVNKLR